VLVVLIANSVRALASWRWLCPTAGSYLMHQVMKLSRAAAILRYGPCLSCRPLR
jgi:hypothetical protein